MSEIALISARKSRLENSAKKGNNSAQIALDLANSPNKFLSTVQIGITLIGILTGIFSGDKITTDVEVFVLSFEILKPYFRFQLNGFHGLNLFSRPLNFSQDSLMYGC